MPHRIVQKIRSSISAKAAFIVTLPVFLIMGFHTYSEYRHDRKQLFHNTEMQLLRIAEGLMGPAEIFIARREMAVLQSLAVDAASGGDIELITVFDPRGVVVASNKGKWVGKAMVEMHPEDITDADLAALRKGLIGGYSLYYDPGDEQYCLTIPLRYGKGSSGAMHVSLDVGTLRSAIDREAVKDFIVLIALIMVIGTSIYIFFYYFFIKRIQSVSSAAARLAAGDTDIRVKAGGTDEIGCLADSFNVMVGDIKNWRNNLEEMVSSRVIELSALYEVASIISGSLDLKSILPKILSHVLETLGERKGIIILGGDGGALTVLGHRGLSEEAVRQASSLGHGCIGDVILKNMPIRIAGHSDEGPAPFPGLEQEDIRSVLAVPLSAHGVVLGAMAVYSPRSDCFSEQDEALLATIGNQTGVAIENARLYERTLELAREDGLTKLANRRHFMELLRQEIDRAARYHTALSVLIMDLDKFKLFNDTYGHLKGDELLKAFGALVRETIRSTDIAARYGGEEFAVILPNTSLKGAATIAERIRKATEQLTILLDDGSRAGATISIGIAELGEGQDGQKILEAADAALYRSKEGGRNRTSV